MVLYFLFYNILVRLTVRSSAEGKMKRSKILHFGDRIGSVIIVIPPYQLPGTYFRNCLSLIIPILRGDRNLVGNDLKRIDFSSVLMSLSTDYYYSSVAERNK